MRRLLIGLVVSATTTLAPMWALAANQEIAEQIAGDLRTSGQLSDYKIGVKYQDGTAWLRGRVCNQQQMDTALKLVFRTSGVKRVVNNLTVGPVEETQSATDNRPNAIPALAPTGVRPLEQVAAAVDPEQFRRSTPPNAKALQSRRAETVSESVKRLQRAVVSFARRQNGPAPSRPAVVATNPQPIRYADQVPSTFLPAPVRQAAASVPQQPTSAPLRQPEFVPQQVVQQPMVHPVVVPNMGRPIPIALMQGGTPVPVTQGAVAAPIPAYAAPTGGGVAPARYDQPHLPSYAWPGYAAYPNYAAVTYPKQHSPTAWPYIGPFYPYPQVPLGWRKVTMEWHDGWWMLDFDDGSCKSPCSGLFRGHR